MKGNTVYTGLRFAVSHSSRGPGAFSVAMRGGQFIHPLLWPAPWPVVATPLWYLQKIPQTKGVSITIDTPQPAALTTNHQGFLPLTVPHCLQGPLLVRGQARHRSHGVRTTWGSTEKWSC